MLNFYNTQIESLSIHRIGNMQKGENIFLSKMPYPLDDEISGLLKEYFFKSFREKEENYMRFSNETHIILFQERFLPLLTQYILTLFALHSYFMSNQITHILNQESYMLLT